MLWSIALGCMHSTEPKESADLPTSSDRRLWEEKGEITVFPSNCVVVYILDFLLVSGLEKKVSELLLL